MWVDQIVPLFEGGIRCIDTIHVSKESCDIPGLRTGGVVDACDPIVIAGIFYQFDAVPLVLS